jgi:hypothetical protein
MPASLALAGALCWFMLGRGRRHLRAAVIVSAAILFAITVVAAPISNWAAPAVLIAGTVGSVLVGWFGYRLPRWTPHKRLTDPISLALAEPTATARALDPEDVRGMWRFYADPVGCTVTVDLQPDGRYRQVIAENSGGLIDGPGGEWSLEGPNLNLDAYRSATRGETSQARWFFGDCQGGLILFVKDDPQADRMLVALRTETGENGEQVASVGGAADSKAKKATHRANSRSSSLFVSRARLGSSGKSVR